MNDHKHAQSNSETRAHDSRSVLESLTHSSVILSLIVFSMFMLIPALSERVREAPDALISSLFVAQIVAVLFSIFGLMKRRSTFEVKPGLTVEESESPDPSNAPPLIILSTRRAHVVQIIAQGSVYVGWCMYWETAFQHIPLLFSQIIFAYLIDSGLSWRRYPTYRLGLGPIPIVLSTNLFLFFTDTAFIWQWGLIAFAMGSRELFRWRREGRVVHIFNPSAISLSLFVLVLIYTETMHFTWGEAIARAHGHGPYSYEIIFGAGLLVSAIFTVGFTISSAAITTLLVGELYFVQSGIFRYVDTGIPIAVFLGMNLLVTDPVSSPWRRDAKVLYGALYGVSVFVLYGLLRDLERPPTADDIGLSAAFCDKLLAVPLLNLSARRLDRLMAWLFGDSERGLTKWILRQERYVFKGRVGRVVFVTAWCVLFASWIRPEVLDHRGKNVNFWVHACEEARTHEPHPYACENLKRVYLRACESSSLPACHNLALSLEERNPIQAQHLYQYACQEGQLQSCNHLGGMLYKAGELARNHAMIERALGVLTVACDGEIVEACTRQAMILRSEWIDRSTWGAQEWRHLWLLLNRGCEGGEPYACLELSQYHLMPPPAAQQRCQAGDQLACITIEEVIKVINSTPKNVDNSNTTQAHPLHAQARAQLSIACGASLYIACVNLGWMMWRGDGGSRDPSRAVSLLEQGCKAGIKEACPRAQWMRQQLGTPPQSPRPPGANLPIDLLTTPTPASASRAQQ